MSSNFHYFQDEDSLSQQSVTKPHFDYKVTTSLSSRQADVDDINDLNSLVNDSGGAGYYKVVFGAFQMPNLLEFSYQSIVVESNSQYYLKPDSQNMLENPELRAQNHLHGYLSINDTSTLLNDQFAFDNIIDGLSNLVPVNVRD